MKYVDFENHSTEKAFSVDGYVLGVKTIAGAASALQKKIEKIARRNLLAMICEDFSIENLKFMAQDNGAWSYEEETHRQDIQIGECFEYYWRSKEYFLRCHIDRIDEDCFFIDFGCDATAAK